GSGIGNVVGGTLSGAANLVGGVASGVGNLAGGAATGVGNVAGGVVAGTGNAVSGLTGGNRDTGAAGQDAYTNTTTYVNPRTQPRPDRSGTYVADRRGMVRSMQDRAAAPDRPQVYRSAGVDPRLQQRVSDTVKSANPSIMYVYVTDDPNAIASLQSTSTTGRTDYRPLIDQIFPSAR
ncbi:MAG: hypothetical protein JWN30_1600, partial [Bacilli bacterium]|nr:hypothetical protein [Bacilli bacterium]